ncbi:MAG: Uma2 family endonuclease [Cyanobacteria bacterium SBLK]|nr:Uma2 family endonuclease [Cyanobacteria bacterium SBLK]
MVQLQPNPLKPDPSPNSSQEGRQEGELPTMYDLPSEDPEEPGLPDEFHDFQPNLLTQTCLSPHYPRTDYFIGKDLNLYYDRTHTQWYKRPDWFLVLGARQSTNMQELRLSYLIWQEEISPFLVVELASPGTEDEDLGRTEQKEKAPPTKWEVYEEILQVPYYVIYDRYENELRGFVLQSGEYEELDLEEGRLWLEELGLGLGLWQGSYEGAEGVWLRFYNRFGDWISTANERADYEAREKQRERQRAISAENERDRALSEKDKERREKDLEKQRADRAEAIAEEAEKKNQQLRDRLIQLGIDPDTLL